jgi:hypothetical protein
MNTNTASITKDKLQKFVDFVLEKNKKAKKLNCPEITYTLSPEYVKNVKLETGDVIDVVYVDVTINEESIRLGNYQVIGRIDDIEGDVIVSGMSDMKKFRSYSMKQCDHCNISRNRKHLVVVTDGTETKAIGSSCLNDFVGHVSAIQYISSISWAMNIEETIEEEGFNSVSPKSAVYSLNEVLTIAAAIIRIDGSYVSKSKAEESGYMSTKDSVMSVMFSKNASIQIIDADRELVKNAIEWFKNTKHDDTDFFHNLEMILSKEYISTRFFGFAIALLPVYKKAIATSYHMEKSEFIGVIGEKKSMTVECINVMYFDSMYGRCYMYHMKNGNDVVIYKTTSTNFCLEVGERANIRCTIKNHNIYKDINQTEITRAKIV